MSGPFFERYRGGIAATVMVVSLGLSGLPAAVWAASVPAKAGKAAANKPEETEVVKPAYTLGPNDRNPMISSTATSKPTATQEDLTLAGVFRQGTIVVAMINGKVGKAGDTLSLTLGGRKVEVEVLEVEANPPAVHLRCQGTDIWKRLSVIPLKK